MLTMEIAGHHFPPELIEIVRDYLCSEEELHATWEEK